MQRQRKLPDLIDKKRAAIGHFKQPFFTGTCTGEGAFLMTKQLTLNQVLSKGAAIDDNQWHSGTR